MFNKGTLVSVLLTIGVIAAVSRIKVLSDLVYGK